MSKNSAKKTVRFELAKQTFGVKGKKFLRKIIFYQVGYRVFVKWLTYQATRSLHQHVHEEIGVFWAKLEHVAKCNFENKFLELGFFSSF